MGHRRDVRQRYNIEGTQGNDLCVLLNLPIPRSLDSFSDDLCFLSCLPLYFFLMS